MFDRTSGTNTNQFKTVQNIGSSYTGVGNGANYSSVSGMFRAGQEKESTTTQNKSSGMRHTTLGHNPNTIPNNQDEMVLNLQQQIHLMDLEMKILKEKVNEDGENDGIGNLYNDEQSMHQHISQLKIKYRDMLLTQEKDRHKINKEQLKEQGQTYELTAQFDSLSKLQQLGKETFQESRDKNDDFKRKSEMQKKDEERKKNDLEQEVTQMANQFKKDSDLKFKNWEAITKYTNNEENEKRRHEKVTKEYVELIKNKTEHKKKEQDALDAAKKAYEDFTAAKRAEITGLTKELMNCSVLLKASVVRLEGMDEQLRLLKEKIDGLDDEKKNLETNNEQQKLTVKGKEELDDKKRQQQIQRDKNPEIIDKQAEQELLIAQLQVQTSALTAEKIKHDNLQELTDNLKEQIKIREKKFKEDEEEVKKQDAALLVLQTKIDAELIIQKDQTQKFAEQLHLNEMLEKKHREEALKFAALEQQIIWIQRNTDFKNNVKAVDMAVFKELVETNNEVNKSLAGLEVKMVDAKKGVNEMELKWQLTTEIREANEKRK